MNSKEQEQINGEGRLLTNKEIGKIIWEDTEGKEFGYRAIAVAKAQLKKDIEWEAKTASKYEAKIEEIVAGEKEAASFNLRFVEEAHQATIRKIEKWLDNNIFDVNKERESLISISMSKPIKRSVKDCLTG